MRFLTKYESAGVSNVEENCGLDKVVRIGYTSLAERVKTIIRQADEAFALRMSDFDDLQKIDFENDEMDDVVTSNEFDKFQYLSMVKEIQQATLERQEILAQREEEQRARYEAWLQKQSEINQVDQQPEKEKPAEPEE